MPFDVPPPLPSFEVSLASRGYSKGLAQTDGPQVLIRPEIAFGSVRLGAYAKNTTSPDYDGEVGAYIGVRKSWGNTELGGIATVKKLVDAAPNIDTTALELSISATQTIGRLKPRLSLTYSPDELGSTGRSEYWEAGSSYQIDRDTSASAGIGIRERTGGPDYTSYNAGLTRTLAGRFAADVRFYGTNKASIHEYYRRRIVVSIRVRL